MKPTPSNHAAPPRDLSCDTEFLSRHSTKVLIQDAATRRYLTVADVWTAQPELALTFGSGSAAVEHVTRKKLVNVQLVLTRAITVSEVIPVQNYLHS